MKLKKGFTLIELLVVVLIIGILAAIAVPKYQRTVAKAELSQLLGATKSFVQAEQSYYLANNTYTNNINNLDIGLNDNQIKCKIEVDYPGKTNNRSYILCYNKNFAVWAPVEPNISRISEIGMNSLEEKEALSYAAKDLFGNSATCFQQNSSTCYTFLGLGGKCFTCVGTKRI